MQMRRQPAINILSNNDDATFVYRKENPSFHKINMVAFWYHVFIFLLRGSKDSLLLEYVRMQAWKEWVLVIHPILIYGITCVQIYIGSCFWKTSHNPEN
jgi:hypothetical protein